MERKWIAVSEVVRPFHRFDPSFLHLHLEARFCRRKPKLLAVWVDKPQLHLEITAKSSLQLQTQPGSKFDRNCTQTKVARCKQQQKSRSDLLANILTGHVESKVMLRSRFQRHAMKCRKLIMSPRTRRATGGQREGRRARKCPAKTVDSCMKS